MSRPIRTSAFAPALCLVALAACDDASTAPMPIEHDVLQQDAALDLAVDPALAETAVETAEAMFGSAASQDARALLSEARARFADARHAWERGRRADALDSGRRARYALADAVLTDFGASGLDGLIAEIESTIDLVSADGTGFDDAPGLALTLSDLVSGARADRARGRDRDAGERMVRARQHTDRAYRADRRHRDRPHSDRPTTDRPESDRADLARLQVAQGAEAVALAARLIGDEPTESQIRLLDTAKELQRAAEAALQAGELARAAALARHAEIAALRAFVDVDGIGHEEAHTVLTVAHEIYQQAEAIVGSGGSPIDLAILERAERLLALGTEKLEAGELRAIGVLWHAATLAAVLVP